MHQQQTTTQLCTALQRLATSESCTEDTAINCRTTIHSLKTITQCTFCIDDNRQSDKPETYVQLVVGGKLSLVVDMEQLFGCGPLYPLVHCVALAPSWTPCQSLVLQCIHTVILCFLSFRSFFIQSFKSAQAPAKTAQSMLPKDLHLHQRHCGQQVA